MNKNIFKKTILATLLTFSLFNINTAFSEEVINIEKTEQIQNQKTTNEKKEIKVYPKANYIETLQTTHQKPFTIEDEKGYYSYESYLEHRDLVDPKKEKNFLFNGGLVNSDKMFINEDKVASELEEFSKRNVEENNKYSENDVNKLNLYSTLTGMTGLKMFNDLKSLEDTVFLFLDLSPEIKDKTVFDNFFKNIYFTAKENNKNIILFPIGFGEESNRSGYNFLKTMFLGEPNYLFNLNERSFYSLSSIKTIEDISIRLVDGLASNNLFYTTRLGFVEPVAIIKINKKGKLISTTQYLDKEKIKEFINQ